MRGCVAVSNVPWMGWSRPRFFRRIEPRARRHAEAVLSVALPVGQPGPEDGAGVSRKRKRATGLASHVGMSAAVEDLLPLVASRPGQQSCPGHPGMAAHLLPPTTHHQLPVRAAWPRRLARLGGGSRAKQRHGPVARRPPAPRANRGGLLSLRDPDNRVVRATRARMLTTHHVPLTAHSPFPPPSPGWPRRLARLGGVSRKRQGRGSIARRAPVLRANRGGFLSLCDPAPQRIVPADRQGENVCERARMIDRKAARRLCSCVCFCLR